MQQESENVSEGHKRAFVKEETLALISNSLVGFLSTY